MGPSLQRSARGAPSAAAGRRLAYRPHPNRAQAQRVEGSRGVEPGDVVEIRRLLLEAISVEREEIDDASDDLAGEL